MPKKNRPTDDQLEDFYKAVTGTKRLITDKVRLGPLPKRKAPLRKPLPDSLESNETLTLAPVTSEEKLAYKQASLPHKILRNLRKGQYNVEAKLDLHGYTVEQAKREVDGFLQSCLQQQVRVALIIHGKGRHHPSPILKNKLNHWLRSLDVVLAFCSAGTTHGSRGAVYVLLKQDAEKTFGKE